MFDKKELLEMSYGLVALLTELDRKRRKIYVRWREAAEEEETEAMNYYDKRLDGIRSEVNYVNNLITKLDKFTGMED